jgi:GAF domain-containing protein
MNRSSDAAKAIAAAARTINHSRSLGETLQTIAEVARESVPGFDHVGISQIHKNGEVETKAAAGDLVHRLDEIQYSLSEGPCVDSLHDSDVVLAPNIRYDQRWPRYVPQAVELGLKSQMAVKLYLDSEGTIGGINFYSTSSDELHPEAEALADVFAAHSAIALGHAHERETLNEALHSRKVIGQAIGILMERFQMNEDRAFAFLVRASSHSNIKLRAIAEEVVSQVNAK